MNKQEEKTIANVLETINGELKAIKHLLAATWREKYLDEMSPRGLTPELFTEEFITVEECAKRLNILEKQIEEFIIVGKRFPDKGWVLGVHYIIIPHKSKDIVRIPWNSLILSFAKANKYPDVNTFVKNKKPKYSSKRKVLENIPGIGEPPPKAEKEEIEGSK